MSHKPKYTLETRAGQCGDHGQYGNDLVEQFIGDAVWLGCPRCHFDNRHSSDNVVRAAAVTIQRDRLMNERLLESGIQPRFRECSLVNWDAGTEPAKAKALAMTTGFTEAFAENHAVGRSVMLLGTVGTGKTHLATAMLQQAIREHAQDGLRGLYATAGSIIREVKATFGNLDRTEASVYADLVRPDLLVIDEVGVQHGTDFERQVLFEVINGRYEQVKPTIIVSNLGIPELRECLGDRAVDRLRDKGGLVVLFRWASARGDV
ncbi:ATP-binding protein [Pseudomonas sp. 10B1]|uniref:ATP-binding protein n=1 Tax=unclassified Pseudomonas TaxID=196821 RepID=UPI002B23099D|nr:MULTISPECIES: ATP-binding protein [unclassified Pseudomonas]MEA9994304.1 ATP-binding protein [Pseudomonas sp. AA4]MEB0088519.1 ATP-binding protein [Pseudomonas sp. RTI1]MEB0126558.1 ATP-binding protein [Pseudomonas sp. CCC1.2]MEB0154629.1 ATP-binding protein [Pseudomonas sp. CCC4.3]MEB0221154.1 ATP-binding protein [Pseudomonas sp. AB12(2023)]